MQGAHPVSAAVNMSVSLNNVSRNSCPRGHGAPCHHGLSTTWHVETMLTLLTSDVFIPSHVLPIRQQAIVTAVS